MLGSSETLAWRSTANTIRELGSLKKLKKKLKPPLFPLQGSLWHGVVRPQKGPALDQDSLSSADWTLQPCKGISLGMRNRQTGGKYFYTLAAHAAEPSFNVLATPFFGTLWGMSNAIYWLDDSSLSPEMITEPECWSGILPEFGF